MTQPLPPTLIADFKHGVTRDLQPWLIPKDAFVNLSNAYVFRGVVKKKGGSTLLGQDPVLATRVENSRVKNLAATVLTGPILGMLNFELGTTNNEKLFVWGSDASATTSTVNAFNNSTKALTFTAVTGAFTEKTWATDYKTTFWGKNYFRSLWVTTPNATANPVRYTFSSDANNWTNFTPIVDGIGTTVTHAQLIFPYRNRLVFLNTTEGGTNFAQRARWSQNGNPYVSTTASEIPSGVTTPTNTNAWRSDIVGKGGFIDAPTSEAIVSAEFYKDTLIVFFERSTWQLEYFGNPILPFLWRRINSERGMDATKSVVRIENGVAGIGYNGIVQSDGTNTVRIDDSIPDEVFKLGTRTAVEQIHGIRDYRAQAIYWNYISEDVDTSTPPHYPDRTLYYNYFSGTWAFFEDSYKVFQHYSTFDDRTWSSFTNDDPPGDGKDAWKNLGFPWNDPSLKPGLPIVVAGNQQGIVHILSSSGPVNESSAEAVSLTGDSAAGVFTVINHNLKINEFILIVGGSANVGEIFKVTSVTGVDTFVAANLSVTPTITNAFIAKVQNFQVVTKRINPVIEAGKVGRLLSLDAYVANDQQLTFGDFSVGLEIDNVDNVIQTLTLEPTTLGSKVWKRVFFNSTGNFFTFSFFLSDDEMFDSSSPTKDVQIHAVMLNMRAAGGRLTK